MNTESTTSRPVAPEDIQSGDYVAILYIVGEHLPFTCEDGPWRRTEPLRMLWLPWEGGKPMKVVEVCLPFLLVRKVNGKHCTLDVRRFRLARVSERFGKKSFKRLTTSADATDDSS